MTMTPVQDLGVTHPRPGVAIRVFLNFETQTNVAITYTVEHKPNPDGYDFDVIERVDVLMPHLYDTTMRHPFNFGFQTFTEANNAANNAAHNLTPEHFGVTVTP